MQKVVNVFIAVLLIAFLSACAETGKELTPVNITPQTDGDMIWTSSFFSGSLKIDKSFTYLGTKDESDFKVRRQYHVWKRDSGEVIFVADISMKTNWNFPDGYDPTLGKEQKANSKYILAHKPMKYGVWTGIPLRSYHVLTSMGISVPKCKVAIQKGKISPSRKSAYFMMMYEERPCVSKTSIGTLVEDAAVWIKMM